MRIKTKCRKFQRNLLLLLSSSILPTGSNNENAFVHFDTIVVPRHIMGCQIDSDFSRVSIFSHSNGTTQSTAQIFIQSCRIESGNLKHDNAFKNLESNYRSTNNYLFFFKQLDSEEVDADPDSPEDEPDFYTEAPLPG